MRDLRKWHASAAGMLLFVVVTCQQTPRLELLQPSRAPVAPDPDSQLVIRSRTVTIDPALLRSATIQRLTLATFNVEVLTIVRTKTEQPAPGVLIWHGRIEGDPGSTVTLSVKGRAVVGNIVTSKAPGRFYRIGYIRENIHRLQQIDPRRFPAEEQPERPANAPPRGVAAADACATDPPTEIDVLVAYSDDARVAAGGVDAMDALVYLAISETNQSYINSNVEQRMRLVHVMEVNYTEAGSALTDVTRLQSTSDGQIDNVHTLRDAHGADVVLLILETLGGTTCGRAFDIMNPVSNAFETDAFAVVKRSCSTGQYSFGHEAAHLMGARHDWSVDATNNSPYAYNHGYFVAAPADPTVAAWRTVMAYNNGCGAGGCARIPYWSNPNVNFPPGGVTTDQMGVAAGAQQSDNQQTLDNTALTVANFRCSSPSATNVWMKDTWLDTGKEPDPATAGQAMWKSPYIWVRNTQDAALTEQHRHQNPELGSSNWVYVKLHNGANVSVNGTLEIYFANAGTSLTWPGAWTLMGSIPVNAFTAHTTRIVEQQWNTVPSTGHYCLIARWVSAGDPMAVPEGSDIGVNVRNNNNLAWRNVNVVDLVSDADEDVAVIIRNETAQPVVTTIVVRGPGAGMQPSFLTVGQVSVQLDSGLTRAWQEGGRRGAGYKLAQNGIEADTSGARFERLILPARFEGRLVLRLHRLARTPRRDFGLDVVQIVGDRVIGGVSYDIRTDRKP